MRLQVNHVTDYTYEGQVYIGVHKLYLFPQVRPHFNILNTALRVSPNPVNQSMRQDLFGNFYSLVWFNDLSSHLKIESALTLEIQSFNPFAFLVDDEFVQSNTHSSLPFFIYSGPEKELISYFVFDDQVPEYQSFIQEFWKGNEDLIGFLVRITAGVKAAWKHVIRYEMDLWSPNYTFAEKRGSCRDLAWMLMNILGNMGLATKFVSGYAFNPELNDGHELHAWLEVYLPGAGWVGLDPSLGLLTDHHYIPLAAHAKPALASPVQGTFTGKGASHLSTDVQIKLVEN